MSDDRFAEINNSIELCKSYTIISYIFVLINLSYRSLNPLICTRLLYIAINYAILIQLFRNQTCIGLFVCILSLLNELLLPIYSIEKKNFFLFQFSDMYLYLTSKMRKKSRLITIFYDDNDRCLSFSIRQ